MRSSESRHARAPVYVGYEQLPMCGINVQLPQGLKPYPTQKLMMIKILTSLRNHLNALIESPTGSGKTLALLASSLAWLADYKRWSSLLPSQRLLTFISIAPPPPFSIIRHRSICFNQFSSYLRKIMTKSIDKSMN